MGSCADNSDMTLEQRIDLLKTDHQETVVCLLPHMLPQSTTAVSYLLLFEQAMNNAPLRPGHTLVRITRNLTRNRLFDTKNNHTRKFERIQTKSASLGVHNDDDGRKITINDKHHLISHLFGYLFHFYHVSLFGNFLLFLSRARLIHGLFIMCFVR